MAEIGIRVPTDTSGLIELIERLGALEARMRTLESAASSASGAASSLSGGIDQSASAAASSAQAGAKWATSWKDNVVAVNAAVELAQKAVGALTGALGTMLERAESGARALEVGEAFGRLGNTADDMDRLRAASVSTFDDTTLQRWENFADRAGSGADAINTLTASTVTMGQEGNKTRKEMMAMVDTVVKGFAKGEGAAFETFGISMGAVAQRAKELNPEFDKLSESAKIAAKQTAGLQLIMEMGLNPSVDSATAKMSQMSTAYDNLISEVEVAIAQIATESGLVDGLQEMWRQLTQYLLENKDSILEWAASAADFARSTWPAVKSALEGFAASAGGLLTSLGGLASALVAIEEQVGGSAFAGAMSAGGLAIMSLKNPLGAVALGIGTLVEGIDMMGESVVLSLGPAVQKIDAFIQQIEDGAVDAVNALRLIRQTNYNIQADMGDAVDLAKMNDDFTTGIAKMKDDVEALKADIESGVLSKSDVKDAFAPIKGQFEELEDKFFALKHSSQGISGVWEEFFWTTEFGFTRLETQVEALGKKTKSASKDTGEGLFEMFDRVGSSLLAELGDRSLYEQMIDLIGEGMASIEVEKIETVMDPFWKNVGESMLTGAQRLGEDVAQRMSDALAENAAAITEAKDMAGQVGFGLESLGLISSQAASMIAENAGVIADATSTSSEAATAGIAAAMTGLESGLGRFLKSERSRAILNIFKEAALAASAIARGIAGDYSQFAAAAAHVAAGVQWGIVAAKAGGGGGGGASATRGASAAGAAASRSSAQLAAGGGFGGPRSRRGGDGAPSQVVINLSSPFITQEQVAQVQQAVDASVRYRDGWAPPSRFSPRGAQSGPGR